MRKLRLPNAMKAKAAAKNWFATGSATTATPANSDLLTQYDPVTGAFDAVVVDASTVFRSALGTLEDTPTLTSTVSGTDIAAMLFPFLKKLCVSSFSTLVLRFDKCVEFAARQPTHLSRLVDASVPHGYDRLIVDLDDAYSAAYNAMMAGNYRAVLTQEVHFKALTGLVSFPATKVKVQQLTLLCAMAQLMVTPLGAGVRVVFLDVVNHNLVHRLHPLQGAALIDAIMDEVQSRRWGTVTPNGADGTYALQLDELQAPFCTQPYGGLESDCTRTGAGAYTIPDAATLERIFYEEALLMGIQITVDSEEEATAMSVPHLQPLHMRGMLDMSVEGDHLCCHPHLFAVLDLDPKTTVFWGGGDTDTLTIDVLRLAAGTHPAHTLCLMSPSTYHTPHLTLFTPPEDLWTEPALRARAARYIMSMVAGCDYMFGKEGVGHSTYAKTHGVDFDMATRTITWNGHRMLQLHPDVRAHVAVFEDYYTTVMMNTRKKETRRAPSRLDTEMTIRYFVWFINYLLHGWKGAGWIRRNPWPRLEKRVYASAGRTFTAHVPQGVYGDVILDMCEEVCTTVPEALRRQAPVAAMMSLM
jgi:hypothetical protein